jgi:hypothetical protein
MDSTTDDARSIYTIVSPESWRVENEKRRQERQREVEKRRRGNGDNGGDPALSSQWA